MKDFKPLRAAERDALGPPLRTAGPAATPPASHRPPRSPPTRPIPSQHLTTLQRDVVTLAATSRGHHYEPTPRRQPCESRQLSGREWHRRAERREPTGHRHRPNRNDPPACSPLVRSRPTQPHRAMGPGRTIFCASCFASRSTPTASPRPRSSRRGSSARGAPYKVSGARPRPRGRRLTEGLTPPFISYRPGASSRVDWPQ